ncbi:hypothetical protein BT67DRAFT_229437 [Trichocladium antarcticum]|uniref:Uncharacterized protein n=1 Tax=Trichocladium antarcticum TaxID=1450529 RepID=A0AAN6UN77_9PEZI|nr:hypothetical protein BT67DRAFT_229437 [Trichocladium antarcticum]
MARCWGSQRRRGAHGVGWWRWCRRCRRCRWGCSRDRRPCRSRGRYTPTCPRPALRRWIHRRCRCRRRCPRLSRYSGRPATGASKVRAALRIDVLIPVWPTPPGLCATSSRPTSRGSTASVAPTTLKSRTKMSYAPILSRYMCLTCLVRSCLVDLGVAGAQQGIRPTEQTAQGRWRERIRSKVEKEETAMRLGGFLNRPCMGCFVMLRRRGTVKVPASIGLQRSVNKILQVRVFGRIRDIGTGACANLIAAIVPFHVNSIFNPRISPGNRPPWNQMHRIGELGLRDTLSPVQHPLPTKLPPRPCRQDKNRPRTPWHTTGRTVRTKQRPGILTPFPSTHPSRPCS